MKLYETLANIANISFFVSIIACFYMFCCYFKLPKKTFGAKMIITLCIADFLFHSGVIMSSFVGFGIITNLGLFLSDIFLRFSVFWSSCIALLLYKLLARDQNARASRYYKCCLCTVLSLSLVFGFIVLYCKRVLEIKEQDRKILITGLSNAPFVISMLITLFYYGKSIRILKGGNTSFTSEATQESMRTLYRYAFVQFFTIGPKVFLSYYSTFTNTVSPNLDMGANILFGLTGFANSLVYFFKRDGFGTMKGSEMNREELDISTLSFYEDHDDVIQFKLQSC